MAIEFCRGMVVLARWKVRQVLDPHAPDRTVLLVRAPGDRPLTEQPIAVYEPENDRDDLELVGQGALAIGLDRMRAGLHQARKVIKAGGELVVELKRAAERGGLAELEHSSDLVETYARELATFHERYGRGLPFAEDLTR